MTNPLIVSTTIPSGFSDLAVDASNDEIYVTSSTPGTVTALDFEGNVLGSADVPGATGIAQVGNDLFVDSSNGVMEIDATTLSAVASLASVGSYQYPAYYVGRWIVFSAGLIWTTENLGNDSYLVSINPASEATNYFPWPVSESGLASNPSSGNELVAWEPFSYPSSIQQVSVEDGVPTQEPAGSDGYADLESGPADVAVSSDGSSLVLPGDTSDMSTLTIPGFSAGTTYPGFTPVAVALSPQNGGMVAGGINGVYEAADVVVYATGSPTTTLLRYTFDSDSNLSLDRGIAFSPDGHLLFDANGSSGSDQLSIFRIPSITSSTQKISATTGSISGTTVQEYFQTPAICVDAVNTADAWENFGAVTDDSGAFTINDVPAGTYDVLFDPTCGLATEFPYTFDQTSAANAIEWYNESPNYSGASAVTVIAGSTTEITQPMQDGGSVTGAVTASGSSSIVGVCVDAVTPGPPYELVESTSTTAGGSYGLAGLPSGKYYILFDPTCDGENPSDYQYQYFNSGALVNVTPGATQGSVDASLALGTPAVSISNIAPASATVATPYFASMSASGGTGPYIWSASGLPPWLRLNRISGTIEGTPTSSGTYRVVFDVRDSSTPVMGTSSTVSLNVSAATAPIVATMTTAPPSPVPPSTSTPSPTTSSTTAPTTTTPGESPTATVAPKGHVVCAIVKRLVTTRKTEIRKGKRTTVIVRRLEDVTKRIRLRRFVTKDGKRTTVVIIRDEPLRTCHFT